MRSSLLKIASGVLVAFTGALLTAGCGGSSVSECVNATGTNKAQYAINALQLPTNNKEHAKDLNGDNRPDNQLGAIIGVLLSYFPDLSGTVNKTIADGTLVMLADALSTDATFQSDPCSASNIYLGQKKMNPDFTGSGTFAVDTSVPPGAFKGSITAGTFRSNNPVTATVPATYSLSLTLIPGAPPLSLQLTGAYAQYTRDASGALMAGQINGAIRNDTVQTQIIPAVAVLLSGQIAMDPTGSGSMTILSIFDTGGAADPACAAGTCKNADGTCAVKGDNKIDVCEVATNPVIVNVLAPDVQLFNGTTYAPSKDNKVKDSLSLGLGFTAVKASF
jgi:hypothetical protein